VFDTKLDLDRSGNLYQIDKQTLLVLAVQRNHTGRNWILPHTGNHVNNVSLL